MPASKRPTSGARARYSVEPLEPRLLYSADLGPSLLAAPFVSPVAEHRLLEPDAAPAEATQAAQQQTQAREIVFIDDATPDAHDLIADIARQSGRPIDIVQIGAAEDGLARIGAELAARQDISAVHIISHGSDGAVYLGRSVLNLESVAARAAQLAGWSASLTDDADVLIYGCDVAGSEAGRAMIDALARLTGADVNASEDPTGAAALGGNWTLEYATGAIEAHLALSQEAQDEWFGLLAVANLPASQDTYIMLSAPANNFGTSVSLVADRESGDLQRVLMQFDLSSIPSNATINSATLKLQATQIGGALNLGVYEVQEGWSEGIGLGIPGAASWNDRALLTPWTTPGSSFNAAAVASINTNAVGQHSWNITSLVQAWVNGTKTNNGIMVGSPDGGGNRTVTYDSRETITGTAPVLVLDYSVNNNAPTLDASKTPALAALNEDAGAPSGAVGTLVSSLVDFATPAGQVDNVTDPDAGAQLGIAVTGANTANGAWWYSTNGGTSWSALGAVSDTTARLLAADASTRIYFQPNANFNGTIAAALTFRAWDQTGGINGGTFDTSTNGGTSPFSSATDTAAITVNSVNDAPSGANNTVTTPEDTAYVFAAADFGFADSDGNALSAVKIAALPGAGTLTNNGVTVTAGQLVSAADIAAGLLRFAPAANANGAGYASFTFQVRDDGGTANGGVDLDPTPRTMTVNVTSVNDAPASASNTVTTLEDTAYVFAAVDFGFADTDGNALAAVKITTLPGAGTLTDNGVAVTAGQFVSNADIVGGLLRFTPVANANGAGYASFTFQVQDDGGTANGGVDLDPTARTMTVNVTGVNDAPAGSSNSVTTPEDTAYVFAAADFGFSDTDGNALAAVKIVTLPGAGTLTNNGAAVTAGQFVTIADIAGGLLVFAPAANASGAGYASFAFQVRDDGGTANGGVDLDPTPRTMTVNVTSVNDAPAGASNTVTTLEDTAYVFAAVDFGFADTDGNALAAVKITTLPGAGTLTDNGVAVTAGQFVSNADIVGGLLRFTPVANANGAGYASFTFQVQDDGGTANGGVDLDPTGRTMTLDVTAVNDAPAGADNSVTTPQDSAYVFVLADFGFSDSNDSASNALLNVQVAAVPATGTLTDNGAAVTAGQAVSAASISAGLLRYTPPAGASGAALASFTFRVQDDGGTANGGVDLDPTARTIIIDVSPASPHLVLPSPDPLPVPVPASPPAAVPAESVPAVPTSAPPTQPIERAAQTARILLASADIVLAIDVDEGLRVPVIAEQSVIRNPAFVSSQRLAAAAPVSASLLGGPAAGQLALDDKPLAVDLFGLISVSDTASSSGSQKAQGLANDLNHVREELADQAQLEHWISGSVAFGSFGLTVGYVLWLLRGGALLASLLSSLPAWRLIDPLPVLARADEDEREEEDEDAFVSFADADPVVRPAEEPA